ncbi:uncharacterized protein LOC134683743, partial [Mytilus trossulus]|uniref:uncharacterized protein LOC134683743 n=1 Tax=Mytilus trossulus TaxID=6551 RepID=UPI003003F470
ELYIYIERWQSAGLKKISCSTCTCKSQYEKKKDGSLQDWKNISNQLYECFLSTEYLSNCNCHDCEESSQLYRCVDCCPWEAVCGNCLQKRHQFPHLHIFEAWRKEAYVGAVLDTPPWTIRSHTCCSSKYLKSIVIVDEKGRQHIRSLQFCKCEGEAITLIRYRLWPSSTKFPRIAFHFDLLKWFNGLLIECHLSVKGFCEALKAKSSKHHSSYFDYPIKDIYKVLISETVTEFRHFLHRIEQPSNLCETLDDGTECPACFSTSTKIYSFDADFQLVRKSSAGKQWEQPKHHDCFFLDQAKVDKFMEDYCADKKKTDVDCSDFQAGNNVRSKNKTTKLSETAVFGSTCRHEYPKYFFSLKHGERLGYSVYLLNKLLEEKPVDDSNPIYVMYDIACNLHSHLKKHAASSVLDKVKFSIPIFHSYGHKMSCQVLYGPRRTSGIGLTDGESLERLWSYLGKFSRITKEMTPENRIDLLTDALLHYGSRIRNKLSQSLPGRMKKAIFLENTSSTTLQELLKPLPGVSDEMVNKWIEDEKLMFSSTNNNQKLELTPKEDYCLKLEERYKMRETLPLGQLKEDITYKRLNKTIQKIESGLKVSYAKSDILFERHLSSAKEKNRLHILKKLQRLISERHFLLDLIKKYARGQAIAIRLSKQVQKVVAKIKQSLAEYNLVGEPSMSFPLKLDFEDIKNQENEIWRKVEVTDQADNLSAVKRQAIQLKSMIDRAKEEQCLVKAEMVSTIKWYRHQHSLLIASMNDSTEGRKACLVKEGLFIEAKLLEFIKSFDEHIIVEESVQTIFFSIVGLDNDVVEINDFELPDFDENVLINVDFVDDDDEDDINVLDFNEENLNFEDFEDDSNLHDI